MTKDILATHQEVLVGSVAAASQALENARKGFMATRIATAESLDRHSSTLQVVFGNDLFNNFNGVSTEGLEEALERAGQRQALVAEALVHGLHEMTMREIAAAATMVQGRSQGDPGSPKKDNSQD